jgi:hypothetical protein
MCSGNTSRLRCLLFLGTQIEGLAEKMGTFLSHRLKSSLWPIATLSTQKKGSFYNESSPEADN